MKNLCLMLAVILPALFTLGCQQNSQTETASAALACSYTQGQTYKTRVKGHILYKTWVEMPNKPPASVVSNERNWELTLRHEVEKVNPDKSALVKVTIEKADYKLNIDSPEKKSEETYSSTPEKTQSSQGENSALAGMSYKVVLEPNTAIRQVIKDESFNQPGLLEKDATVPAFLIREKMIKSYHEHNAVRYGPRVGEKSTRIIPIPDPMIKAQVIRMDYQSAAADGDKLIKISGTGTALDRLPPDMPAPEKPAHIFGALIQDRSQTQEFTMTDEGVLNVAQGLVERETQKTHNLLILDGGSIFPSEKKVEPGSAGFMFTLIDLDSDYEVIK